MNNLIKLLTIGVLVAAIVGVCGCANPLQTVQNAGSPTNKALDYANAFVNDTKAEAGSNTQIVKIAAVANGSDAARVSATLKNNTHDKSSLWANGTTVVYALNVKQFASTDEASKFYADQSFGYTTNNTTSTSTSTLNQTGAYHQVTGHEPTVKEYSYKLNSFNFVQAEVSVAAQTDEYVIWGTVTISGI